MTPDRFSAPIRSTLFAAGLAACLLALGGCEVVSMAAFMATGGDKIKPVYTLPDRPTVILVDDPRNVLGSPVLAGVIGSHVAHHLKENGALTAKIIPESEVSALADRLGDAYATMPIDEIGRRLGAKQVIYLELEEAALLAAPGAYRPVALLELKVVDTDTGERLYPPPPPIYEPGAPSRGRSVSVQMHYKGIETHSRGADAMLAEELAKRIALDVARLFYEHRPDPKFE